MKNFAKVLGLSALALLVFSCGSTKVVPSEIEYKEISSEDYFKGNKEQLYSNSKGYKITDVYLLESKEIGDEILFRLSKNDYGGRDIYATDFAVNIVQTDPTWGSRVGSNNRKYNGHYTVWVYGEKSYNFIDGSSIKEIIYNIEGVPTQEQINADKAAEEAERLAKEEADKKAKAEKDAALEAKAKAIAKGYVYHGIDEEAQNVKFFINGALEEGHAYYISDFGVKNGGNWTAIRTGLGFYGGPSDTSPVHINYISQKVKGEVVSAWGYITVVVAGGKAPTYTPVVLGLVE